MRCLDACQFMSKQNLWLLLDISPRTSNRRIYFNPQIERPTFTKTSQTSQEINGNQIPRCLFEFGIISSRKTLPRRFSPATYRTEMQAGIFQNNCKNHILLDLGQQAFLSSFAQVRRDQRWDRNLQGSGILNTFQFTEITGNRANTDTSHKSAGDTSQKQFLKEGKQAWFLMRPQMLLEILLQ